jgi:sugar phosphate isomerase/epimerase
MKNPGAALGVQSWCFRHYKTNPEVIRETQACDLNAIELCGAHADFKNPAVFDDVIRTYRRAGVKILSIGVQGLRNQPKIEEHYFRFVKQAGAKFMSVSFDMHSLPKCLAVADRLAAKYGVKLGIHNHGGYDWLGNLTALDYVFQRTSPRVGLCLDTAWALQAGINPLKMIEKFGPRIHGVHVKDFVFDRAGKPEDVVAGTGNLDLKALFAALEKARFRGYMVIEYEGDVENPTPAIRRCVQRVRRALA